MIEHGIEKVAIADRGIEAGPPAYRLRRLVGLNWTWVYALGLIAQHFPLIAKQSTQSRQGHGSYFAHLLNIETVQPPGDFRTDARQNPRGQRSQVISFFSWPNPYLFARFSVFGSHFGDEFINAHTDGNAQPD